MVAKATGVPLEGLEDRESQGWWLHRTSSALEESSSCSEESSSQARPGKVLTLPLEEAV